MKTFSQLVEHSLNNINEIFPWDLEEILQHRKPYLLDIREPEEFNSMKISASVNIPRGVLEAACDYGYDETVPELVNSRDQEIIVICRSGNRSALAADTMQQMGYSNVYSLKTGVRGWNEYDQALFDKNNQLVDPDSAENYLRTKVRPEQLEPI